jgi:hypothetical protein
MSFDLEIVTRLKPLPEHFQEFGSTQAYCFTVDGPFEVEVDDLEEQVIASVLDPHWLTQISVPAAASNSDLKLAGQLAKHIAVTCDGSVYDPQLDKVVWPRQSRRRFVAPAKEERIRLVGLDWYLPSVQSSRETAKVLLQTLRKTCPEALPTRFGTFEPLQHRMETNGESFVSVWEEVSRVEYGDMFFWKTKSPFYGGDISFPDQREPRLAGVKRAIHFSMSVDGRALDAEPAWRETVVRLFVELARRLRAFYGVGYVQRNVIARRSIFFDTQSEGSPTLPGRWWLGLPPTPTWLAWFGAGYRNALEASVKDRASLNTPEGILFRLGDAALDVDQLYGIFPPVPRSLFAQWDGNQFQPAQVIPELE